MQDKKLILVIDDDQEFIDVLSAFLHEKNFQTVAFRNGSHALKFLEGNLPDLVVTDLLLPGEHGLNIIKEIKEKYFIPIIVVSGIYGPDELAQIAKIDFVEDFFVKPVKPSILVEKIQSVLKE